MTEAYWYFFSEECVCWWALEIIEINGVLVIFVLSYRKLLLSAKHLWQISQMNGFSPEYFIDLDKKLLNMQKPLWVRMWPLSSHNLENAFPQILQEHGKVCVLRCIFRAPWLLNVWSFIGISCRTNVSFSLAFSPSALFALLSPVFPAHFHSNRWVL